MNWVATLITFLGQFWPVRKLMPYEQGVRFLLGKWWTPLDPGWYWCLPFFHDITAIVIRPQVIDLKNQAMTTKDGVCVAVSGMVAYSIVDAEAAILNVYDYDRALQNATIGVISEHVTRETFNSFIGRKEEIEGAILEAVQVHAAEWGLEINSLWVSEFARCWALRHLTDSAGVPETIRT